MPYYIIVQIWTPSSGFRSVRVAERLALPTSDHGVAGSNPAGGEILPEPKRRFIAQSLSCSPSHRLKMTAILLKTLIHPSIFWLWDASYRHDGDSLVHTFTFIHYMILSQSKKILAVMPVYRRVGSFIILLHFLVLIAVYKQDISTFSLLKLVQDSENLALNIRLHNGYIYIYIYIYKKSTRNRNDRKYWIVYQDCIVLFINYCCLLACFSNITFRRYPSKSRSNNATISK